MTRELLPAVEERYPVSRDRSGRAITGLSMAASAPCHWRSGIRSCSGPSAARAAGWIFARSPKTGRFRSCWARRPSIPKLGRRLRRSTLIPRIADGDLAIVIDCGYDDFFFGVNNDFHAELLRRGIMHDFYVRPGRHNNEYWGNSIDYQIVFFRNFFFRDK